MRGPGFLAALTYDVVPLSPARHDDTAFRKTGPGIDC